MSEMHGLARQGLWTNNPAMVQMLGLCPLLAVSNTLVTSLTLGVITLLVLTSANIVVSLLRHQLLEVTRLPAQIMIIATFVTLADLLLQAYAFGLHQRIGLFVALIVTNCVILGRTESLARRNPVATAAFDGLMMGGGFLWVITLLGAARELLGQGTLLSGAEQLFGPTASTWQFNVSDEGLLLVMLPPGAFITFGCLVALKNWIDRRHE